MSTVQDPRKTWLAIGSLLTVWWRMPFLRLRLPLAFRLWLLHACLSTSGRRRGEERPARSQLTLLWYSLNPLFCEPARLRGSLEPLAGKFSLSLFFFLFLWLSQSFGWDHISSLRLSSGHSGPVLSLSIQLAPPCSAPAHWWRTQASGLLLC